MTLFDRCVAIHNEGALPVGKPISFDPYLYPEDAGPHQDEGVHHDDTWVSVEEFGPDPMDLLDDSNLIPDEPELSVNNLADYSEYDPAEEECGMSNTDAAFPREEFDNGFLTHVSMRRPRSYCECGNRYRSHGKHGRKPRLRGKGNNRTIVVYR